jgi:hypothetical protein
VIDISYSLLVFFLGIFLVVLGVGLGVVPVHLICIFGLVRIAPTFLLVSLLLRFR